jgi:non-canonical purine NTP pyrophosphatase (RdgB/HAM1 family)
MRSSPGPGSSAKTQGSKSKASRAGRAYSRRGSRARYVCELVAVSPAGDEVRGSGILEGRIVAEPHGTEGFGFDPIFVPAGEERTVAELGDEWKAQNSHRARAAKALRRALEQRRDPPPGLRPPTS